MLFTTRSALPEFVSVTVRAALLVFTVWLAKSSEPGATEMAGAGEGGGAVPVFVPPLLAIPPQAIRAEQAQTQAKVPIHSCLFMTNILPPREFSGGSLDYDDQDPLRQPPLLSESQTLFSIETSVTTGPCVGLGATIYRHLAQYFCMNPRPFWRCLYHVGRLRSLQEKYYWHRGPF